MLEGAKSSGLKVRVFFVLAAMVLAILAATSLYNAPVPMGTKEADAAVNWRPVQGTIYHYNSATGTTWAAPFATVTIYRFINCSHIQRLSSTTANAYGQYYFPNVATGWPYRVQASRAGYIGGTNCFYLYSNSSYPVNANVVLRYRQ